MGAMRTFWQVILTRVIVQVRANATLRLGGTVCSTCYKAVQEKHLCNQSRKTMEDFHYATEAIMCYYQIDTFW